MVLVILSPKGREVLPRCKAAGTTAHERLLRSLPSAAYTSSEGVQVPVAVRVHAKITGQRRAAVAEHAMPLDLPSGEVSAATFLGAVVRAEVLAYQARAEERTLFRVLTERSLTSDLETGRVLTGGQDRVAEVDADAAVEEALLAFQDGFFKVFVDDDEVESLGSTVTLAGEANVLFLRLVPLAGG